MTRTERTRDEVPAWEVGSSPVPGYRVLDHMRRGQDLDVYDVWSTERRCRCVLKTIRPDQTDGFAARIVRREARLLLRCTHPSLVRAYELIETAAGPVVVLEALPGATLSVILDEQGRLDTRDLGHLGVHLTSAVHYLHGRGYLHRDVKPSNIVAHRGRATLIDMSLVRAPGPAHGGSGTRGYMAPEQISGGDLGPATDVWGLGAVLYEAATGRPAVHPDDIGTSDSGASDAGGADPRRNGRGRNDVARPPRPPRVRAHRRLPVDIAAVLDACLEVDPARRPTVEVLAEAMAELSGEPPDGVYQD